jgi:hypothetical protein
MQTFFNVGFAGNVNDTWLDLLSNVVGALLSAACFVPFIDTPAIDKKRKRR